jgi:molecular chaperone DnaK
VEVHVLQGEGEMVSSPGVRSLGRFLLVGIPPAPRQVPQIEVTFDIDANGIVNVSAKDTATGMEQAMTITGGTALPREDIDRMVREAEQFAEEDRKRREAAEARNDADNLAYQAEKTLKDLGDKVPPADREAVEKAVAEVREALKGEDVDRIRARTEELLQALQRVGQAVYQQAQEAQAQQQAATGGGGADAGPAGGDDVVEGEVVDEGGES